MVRDFQAAGLALCAGALPHRRQHNKKAHRPRLTTRGTLMSAA
jgi:hypothetical protein